MSEKFLQIKKYLELNVLPSQDELFLLAEKACSILEDEICEYRPVSSCGDAGSLLDFQNTNLPFIVIPDLHARPKFLLNILTYELPDDFLGSGEKKSPKISVFEALEQNLIKIVCVGDALHSEWGTKQRWLDAEKEFDEGCYIGPNMTAEMISGLSLLCGLMKLKELFPENFHFLKGNHENILNISSDGDYAFRKFADEGNMVRLFMTEYYGEAVLYMMACVESQLPLIAVTKNCVVSHGEPAREFLRQQLIDAREDAEVVEALIWTNNGDAEEGSAAKIIQNLTGKSSEGYVYLGGHRPVKENYCCRQGGCYIQIHNPGLENVALVYSDRKFNPDTDIVSVKKGEK